MNIGRKVEPYRGDPCPMPGLAWSPVMPRRRGGGWDRGTVVAVRDEQQVPGEVPPPPLVRPPGPRGMPLLGTAIHLKRDLLGTFHRALCVHGDVVRFVAGPPGLRTELYVFFHPDGVQHVLAGRAAHYCKGGGVYDELRPV